MQTRTLTAFNTATASENKIHDDAVASRFGFTGGLVPGVDVFAYLAHMPMAAWGKDWLGGGFMQARFVKPVYDGDTATVSSEEKGGLHARARSGAHRGGAG
jgi:acyl dehydratase